MNYKRWRGHKGKKSQPGMTKINHMGTLQNQQYVGNCIYNNHIFFNKIVPASFLNIRFP